MAMTYQNFASLGVNLNRQKYGPLDISNVFTSENDLKYYLTKGAHTEGVSEYWYKTANDKVVPYPYEGQVLATVIDGVVNVYALSLDAEGNFRTQEIAGKIEVDDKTIKLNADGKLELVGLPDDIANKTFVPSLVNGTLVWTEPDTSTAEGQQQAIDGLNTRVIAIEEAINGKDDGDTHVEGLVEKVVTNTQAIIDEASARTAADKTITDSIGEVAEGKTVVEMISDAEQSAKGYADSLAGNYDAFGSAAAAEQNAKDYADATLENAKEYTDAEIDGLSVTIEQKEGIEYIIVKDKDGNEVTSANASKFVQDSFLNDVAYDAATGKVTFTWSMGDGSQKIDEIDIKHLVDTYTAGNGLKVESNEFAIDHTIVATVEELNKVKATAEAAQTAEQVGAAIDAKIQSENLAQYAKADDVEAGLASKVDNAVLEDYYTKTEVENKGYAVNADVAETYATKTALQEHEESIATELLAYAKTADVSGELAKKLETGSIAHSTEELAEGVTVSGTELNIVVDAFTKAETRQYVADTIKTMTGGESAADVKLLLENHVAAYTEKVGQIDTKDIAQDTAIAAAQAQADKGVSDAAKVASDLAAANIIIGDNTTEIEAVKGTITEVNEALGVKIAALETKDTELADLINGLDTAIKANAESIAAHTDAINALETKDIELVTQISTVDAKFANYTDTDGMNKAIDDKIAAIPAVDLSDYAKTADIDAAMTLKANATDVYTKEEAEAAFMSEAEVDARIDALIIGADPEGGKTIENIQNLVKYVDENAGEITAVVTATNKNTAKLNGIETTVTEYVAAQVATIVTPKTSTEVTVAEDGTLGIGEVSTDKLVQGDKILLLFGGDAEVAVE